MRAVQAAAAPHDVAFRQLKMRAHELKSLEVLIHGARPDGATARQRNARLADARQQRPQAQHGSPHGLHQIIRCFRMQLAGADLRAVIGIVAGAAQHIQQVQRRVDVAQVRHVLEPGGAIQQDGRKQYGKRGVLGAVDGNGPLQPDAALDDEFIHNFLLKKANSYVCRPLSAARSPCAPDGIPPRPPMGPP